MTRKIIACDALGTRREETRRLDAKFSLPNQSHYAKLNECQIYNKKGVNTLPKVTLRSDESQEQLLRRFSREVVKSRLLTDVRRKRWFVSKSELERIAKKKAARRTRKSQKEQQQGV